MIIVCSWCRREGKSEYLGEKAPFDDASETHGICYVHRDEVQSRWWNSIRRSSSQVQNNHEGSTSALFRWTELLDITKRHL